MNDFHINDSLGYLMRLAATSMRQAIQGQLATYGHQITMPRWHILNRLWV